MKITRFLGILGLIIMSWAAVSAQQVDQNVQTRQEMAKRSNMKKGGGDTNTFLVVIDGNGRKIQGDYGKKNKENWIPVSGFSQVCKVEDENNSDKQTSVELGNLKVVKSVDASSARLMEAMIESEDLKSVDVLVLGRNDANEEIELYLIRLEDVKIESIKTILKVGNGLRSNTIQEEIVFSYDRIFWSYKEGSSAYQASSTD